MWMIEEENGATVKIQWSGVGMGKGAVACRESISSSRHYEFG